MGDPYICIYHPHLQTDADPFLNRRANITYINYHELESETRRQPGAYLLRGPIYPSLTRTYNYVALSFDGLSLLPLLLFIRSQLASSYSVLSLAKEGWSECLRGREEGEERGDRGRGGKWRPAESELESDSG